MHGSAGFEDFLVKIQEIHVGKAVFGALVFDLRIGKRDPDFINFARLKKVVDEFDLCAQKSGVANVFLNRSFGSAPHAGTFNVDADKVFFMEESGEGKRVFAFATTQFEHYRIVVLEKFPCPISAQVELAAKGLFTRGLDNVGKSFVFAESL